MTAPAERRLVLVVGVGRSGTSLLAGILSQLGLHIPPPEVRANETNPRGFGEPRWVVDFHKGLLREHGVTVNDGRPVAWELMARTAADPAAHGTLRDWLAGALDQHGALVVKDPRTSWFLPLWLRCARELGVRPDFVTMLRHPAETLTSARQSYGTWQTPASRAAAWVNVALETEHATRGSRRAFIRYHDLLADWRRELERAGAQLELPMARSIDPVRAARVDEFVDPALHRNRVGWDELDAPVPRPVRELAEDAWSRLQPLARPGGDAPETHAALDAARSAYATLYAEAEATAQSSITAAKRGRPKRSAPPPPPTLYVRLARRVPAPYRKRLRRALHALGRVRREPSPPPA